MSTISTSTSSTIQPLRMERTERLVAVVTDPLGLHLSISEWVVVSAAVATDHRATGATVVPPEEDGKLAHAALAHAHPVVVHPNGRPLAQRRHGIVRVGVPSRRLNGGARGGRGAGWLVVQRLVVRTFRGRVVVLIGGAHRWGVLQVMVMVVVVTAEAVLKTTSASVRR